MQPTKTDVPAAAPLAALVAGLAAAPALAAPRVSIALLALAALLAMTAPRLRTGSTLLLFAAFGVLLATGVADRRAAERSHVASLHPERFVKIEAPLERGWAARDDSFVLRSPQFAAAGVPIDVPVAIYARFQPPPISTESHVRIEGFLRENDHGEYVVSAKSAELLSYEGALPRWHPAAWNRMLANRLDRHLDTHPEEVALAQALLLGRGERLTEEMREGFRRGGTYHLLVFSGLQIAFAAGLLAALLRWIHAPRASDWMLLLFAALAPPFIGSSASVSRASVAIALYAISRILRRPTSVENLWCVAAILRLAFEPRDLTDPSFHLTYAGAGALLFIGKHLLKTAWASHALAAEVTIAPVTLYHFHQYTLGGSLLTLAMAPVIFAILVVSSLACIWPRFLDAIRLLNRICAAINGLGLSGYFAAPPLSALLIAAALTLIVLGLLRGRSRAIALSLVLLIPSIAAVHRSLSRRAVEHPQIIFFDVGQGDSMAIRDGRHTMLVDGGRERRLLGVLADRGIRRIDSIVLSHAHPDHCETLPEIIQRFDVGRVFVSPHRFRGECAQRILAACSETRTPILLARDRQELTVGTVALTVHAADRRFRRSPENNASVVLHARAGGRSFLLTGDIEREAEFHFDDRDWRADVLKVAHHGSRSSTGAPFLDAVAPRLAVISCGRRNLFGHPHPDVIAALNERRIRTLRTDRDGEVTVEVVNGRLYVRARNR